MTDPTAQVDLRRLAERGLVMDVNVQPNGLDELARLLDVLPEFPIILDHAANVPITGAVPPERWQAGMEVLAARSHVFCKVSRLVESGAPRDGGAPAPEPHYRPVLESLWQLFGEDRLLFGSNWPLVESVTSLTNVVALMRPFFDRKGPDAARKFFGANSQAVYRCPRRTL